MYIMSTEADRIKETANLFYGDPSKIPNARLVPSQEEYDLRIAKDQAYGMFKENKLQTENDILVYGALPDGNTDQGSIELANYVKNNTIKVYDNTIAGNPIASGNVSKLPGAVQDLYSVTDLNFYSQFDKYDYPLAQQGNYFVAFDPNSSNLDIAAFSRDVYRITNTNNEGDLYNKLNFTEWQDIIKSAFNIGRNEEDKIDIINDQNLGSYDLRAIAFVAKLKYHDPSKLTNPDFQNNRVFIGFKNEYYNEPIGRLNRLANDAYIFLAKIPNVPVLSPVEIINNLTPTVEAIAQDNEKKEVELIKKVTEETLQIIRATELPYYWLPAPYWAGLGAIAILSLTVAILINKKKRRSKS